MSQAASVMEGRLSGADATFRGVSIDSRSLAGGELFVALKGPNFDGADYLPQAAAAGAAGAVTEAAPDAALPCIVVEDSRAALGRLARDWRKRMPATVIAVTGSNGKTTCKELLASCLSATAATLATEGNLNNDLGLPLMLTRMAAEHRYAVLEMGANHAGEIAYLTSLAEPAIVLISNAGPAHLEGFGSLDGVARAKGEILQGAVRPTHAVLNADDVYFPLWRGFASDLEIISFGYAEHADVRLANVEETGSGTTFELALPDATVRVRLPLSGLHNAANAAAAAAAAHAVGLGAAQIREGLQAARPLAGRLRPLSGIRGSRLFDDSYNANPASVIAAAHFVAAQPGRSYLVLGDMGELGDDAAALHREVGKEIHGAGVTRLFALGPLSKHAVEAFGAGADWFASAEDLLAALEPSLAAGTNVLVKGSRSMRMERLAQALTEDREGR